MRNYLSHADLFKCFSYQRTLAYTAVRKLQLCGQVWVERFRTESVGR